MLARTAVATPLGPFTIVVGEGGVIATTFGTSAAERRSRADDVASPIAETAVREVQAYFARRLRAFRTPVDLSSVGDGFARRVLELVRTIPYGELWTYGDVAAGSALARCPIELFVPCHRVVRADRSLGSYGGHDERRRALLELEGSLPLRQ